MRMCLKPLSIRACWYGGLASLKISSVEERELRYFSTFRGRFFRILGGWLDWVWMYQMGLFGFLYGLC